MSVRLGNIALGAGRASATTGRQVADIITFIEAPWGLGMNLFPVQRIILKAYYGLALDDNPHGFPLDVPVPNTHPAYDPDLMDYDGFYKNRIVVTDWRKQNPKCMTEAQYLAMLHAQGRCNIGVVVPGQERREMVLSIGRRSGKCVTGDTLVLTDRGIFPISELGDHAGPGVQPLDVGVAQEGYARARSAYFYNGGVKPTVCVQSHIGVQIEGTGNHRVKVLGPDGVVAWKQLDDVCEGDILAVHRTADLWASEMVDVRPYHAPAARKRAATQPNVFDERWGLLMGYLVGDGSWANKSSIAVTVKHPETRAEVDGLLVDLCGKVSRTPDKRTSRAEVLRAHDRALRAFFHNLGFRQDTTSFNKVTPWVVMRSPKSVVRAYLQGLFETDGSVTADGRTVSFSTASARLARETQVLLLNLGIVTQTRVKHVARLGRDYYKLSVLGLASRQAFAREVGFRSHKKQRLLNIGLSAAKDTEDIDSIPHQQEWVARLLASVPEQGAGGVWPRSTLQTILGNVCKPGSGEDLTYVRVQALVPIAVGLGANPEVVSHFWQLLQHGYFYDTVVSVSRNEAHVYDLNVPDGASFVANGLTNHNTTISACIAAYETYRLISKGDPQKYYGVPASNNIQLISVATDKDQAGLLYQEVSGHFRKCHFFAPYTANNTQSYARFQTPKDIERYGPYAQDPGAKATIKVTFRSCVAKGLRGAGNIVVVLDEMAHFTDDGQSSADEVYKAIVPSTAMYSRKDPNNPTKPVLPEFVESKVISISSPLGREGLFYKLFQDGFRGGSVGSDRLCVQAPTWEVNVTIAANFFESEYVKDPRTFFTEFGADFTDRTRGWIEDANDLLACIDKDARPKTKAPPRMPHYMGVDVGLVADSSAIAIGHMDEQNRVVLDLVDWITAGEGDFAGQPRLDFTEVGDWIADFPRRFYIEEGMFDQWAGIPMEQALAAKGLKQLESVHHTPQLTSQMYQNFKDLMFDKRLVLYDWPIPPGKEHSLLIEQLLELQAEYKSKYVTIVKAPKVAGKHDDLADALVRMVWLASRHVSKTISFGTGSRPNHTTLKSMMTQRTAQRSMMQAQKKARQSGSSPERMIPKKIGFGRNSGGGSGRGRR